MHFSASPRASAAVPFRRVCDRIFSLLSILVLIGSPVITSFGATFPGTNTGAVADGGNPNPTCGAQRNINFGVSGLSSAVGAVGVNFTMNPVHTWIGDLQVSLIAPNGATRVLFGRVGANTATDFGDDSDVAGPYFFADTATLNLWTVASTTGAAAAIPAASYRSQASGPFATDSPGPAFTSMNSAFAAMAPAVANGNWTLRFQDCAQGDTGTVSAANLTILGPSAGASSISGRVTTADGNGIRNAVLTITGGDLSSPVTAISGPFGYYSFDQVQAGQFYVLSISSKRFTFSQPVVGVTPDVGTPDTDFTADPSF